MVLAILFAASTVLFGVGTGFGGLQDVLLQDRAVGGPSESDARKRIAANANDAQAHRDLAEALQNKRDVLASIQPLAKYVELRPNDVDAKRELAGLYLRKADQHRTEAQLAQLALQQEVPGQLFQPDSSSKIGQALGADPVTEALSTQHNERLTTAFTAMTTAYSEAVAVYKEIAQAVPNDPAVQFELAQTAEAANDLETALTAYKRFVELAPEDRAAEAVKQRIEQLEARVSPPSDG